MYRRFLSSIIFTGMALCLTCAAWAQQDLSSGPDALGSNPPVFQELGLLDTTMNFVDQAECRECHSSGVPNRHHVLYGTAIPPTGPVPYPDADGNGVRDTNYSCMSCHGKNFTAERNCVVCHTTSPHHTTEDAVERHCSLCHGDLVADYDDGHYVPTYSASFVTPKRSLEGVGYNEDGTPETISTGLGSVAIGDLPLGPQTRRYPNTLKYHPPGLNNDFIISAPRGSTYDFTVEFLDGAFGATWDNTNKILIVSIPNGAPVTANALLTKINTTVGATWATIGFDGPPDAEYPPYHYAPNGGLPLNNRGFGAGACSYCHDDDGARDINGDPAPIIIKSNYSNHHGINLGGVSGMVSNGAGGTWRKCNICHDYTNRSPHLDPADPTRATYSDVGGPGFNLHIRVCEECHSPASLHNIQADSNGNGIVVGGETKGYGHIGADGGPGESDCWGCHGFEAGASSAPYSGPLIPTLYNTDVASISAGKAATVLLSGAAFTNTANQTLYESDVRLTAEDGTSVTLKPDVLLDQGNLAVTIPASTLPGNYKLQAAKGDVASNPVVLSVIPVVTITKASGTGPVTITGRGFGGYAVGAGTTVTGTISGGRVRGAQTRTIQGTIISWSDKQIVARFREVPQTVSVSSVFGKATVRVGAR